MSLQTMTDSANDLQGYDSGPEQPNRTTTGSQCIECRRRDHNIDVPEQVQQQRHSEPTNLEAPDCPYQSGCGRQPEITNRTEQQNNTHSEEINLRW
jgi:hypothetical protein